MELLKQTKGLEFKWKDVSFHIRARATAEDRFEINVLYDVDRKGEVIVPRRNIYKTLIERFVTGWTGVTDAGNPVPFSWENLGSLPADKNDDVVLLLGSFIFNHCGLWPSASEADKKKG